jgi:hypothetical protein
VRAIFVLALLTTAAHAENEQALSVGVSLYSSFSAPGEAEMNMAPPSVSPTYGSGVFASYERMLGSDLGLRAELAGNVFFGGNTDKQSSTSYAVLGDVGFVFRFDVLHVVPYAFAGAGGVWSTGGPIDRDIDYLLVVGGGVDWLRSRKRSYGIELRLGSFAGDVTVATIGIRGTQRWGFF